MTMRMLIAVSSIGLTAMLALVAGARGQQPRNPAPEVIFVNGDIYPGAVFQPAITDQGRPMGGASLPPKLVVKVLGPRTQAMAVRDGRIIAMGSNDEIRKLKGAHTREIDLGGHFVMPGFNDAHTHLASGGAEKLAVDLVGVKSLNEMKLRISAREATAAAGEWLLGGGWDHTLWEQQKLPLR